MAKPRRSAESLCLAARERRTGSPLTAEEVRQYLSLLGDERTAPDPDDPPSYDWTGGAPLAGGSQMQVAREAELTLNACGGAALADELSQRLNAECSDDEREAIVVLTLKLLGCRHPLITAMLHHQEPAARGMALRAFAPIGWRVYEYMDLLSPLLIDEDAGVAQQVCALMREAGAWLSPKLAHLLPDGLMERAVHRLQQAAVDQQAPRMACAGYAALLSGDWARLASVLVQRSSDALSQVVCLPGFTSACIAPLLNAQPALREGLRDAVYARFSAARQGWRYHELPLVCCFAPDASALELGMEELALRASAAIEMMVFIEHDPSLMPRLLGAALASARLEQVDAYGIKALLLANPQAFAHALLAAPDTLKTNVDKIREVLDRLPSRQEGAEHMAVLTALL